MLPEGAPDIAAVLAGAAAPSGGGNTPAGRVIHAIAPVRAANGATLGAVYVHVPAAPVDTSNLLAGALPLLGSGLLLLFLIAPVGALFGLLTTRRLVRRLHRLADASAAVAGGDFSPRVPVADAGEIGRLEGQFNAMAGQLRASLATRQELAEENARLTERSRITRELHDGISQDLFSLRLLTGGLQGALPLDAALQPDLAALEQTTERMARELRALLLELRPTVLAERGLRCALEDVIAAYSTRLGIIFASRIEPLTLAAGTELAVLRISQEAIANAVRHAGATAISLSLTGQPDTLTLLIIDDGKGLDATVAQENSRLGLRLMRERVWELHGALTVTAAPGAGTQLRVCLPRE